MSIEIKKSEKPVIYEDAKKLMEERLLNVDLNKSNELIWTLEHPDIYTAGTSYSESDILDKSIKILETNRGGKITYHGPGQLICYFVIDLKKRKKDIRNFISIIEKTIIETLDFFNIKSFSDKENIGIWYKDKEQTPIFEQTIHLNKQGVASFFKYDYPEYSLELNLKKVELTPLYCDS